LEKQLLEKQLLEKQLLEKVAQNPAIKFLISLHFLDYYFVKPQARVVLLHFSKGCFAPLFQRLFCSTFLKVEAH
jgi:hypothetical protein